MNTAAAVSPSSARIWRGGGRPDPLAAPAEALPAEALPAEALPAGALPAGALPAGALPAGALPPGGSACGGSACGGSACGGSACGGSACGGSACGGSACGGSACGGSACGSGSSLAALSPRRRASLSRGVVGDAAAGRVGGSCIPSGPALAARVASGSAGAESRCGAVPGGVGGRRAWHGDLRQGVARLGCRTCARLRQRPVRGLTASQWANTPSGAGSPASARLAPAANWRSPAGNVI